MYFTDRGIEELTERRGAETVSLEWLAEQLRVFVDQNPQFETAVDRLATWLARDDDSDVGPDEHDCAPEQHDSFLDQLHHSAKQPISRRCRLDHRGGAHTRRQRDPTAGGSERRMSASRRVARILGVPDRGPNLFVRIERRSARVRVQSRRRRRSDARVGLQLSEHV